MAKAERVAKAPEEDQPMSAVAIDMSDGFNGRDIRRVLVVDDEKHIIRLIQVNLERAGYEVDTATTVAQALTRMQERPPDLLITDIAVPEESDGLALLAHVRRDSATTDLPVIMLAEGGKQEQVRKAYQAGADMCLTKPFNPAELIQFAKGFGR